MAAGGTVCSDRFDNREALVICKMFGHQYGIARSSAYFGRGTGRIFMDDLNCKGDETSILDCPYSSWGRHNCGHHQDAGVECSSDGDKGKCSFQVVPGGFGYFQEVFFAESTSSSSNAFKIQNKHICRVLYQKLFQNSFH